jgi:hypothetical protein
MYYNTYFKNTSMCYLAYSKNKVLKYNRLYEEDKIRGCFGGHKIIPYSYCCTALP